ncbi:glycoside hydrolase family 36 protein [Flavivirga abyssicola]|uniref:glycoside hydrolase family 36 protein n=1 Tax=Flavivirga abyssicola TaxID=3063533 RepID=UPI0026DF16BE|nr:glycoside hydrolase family 36 protein [Flavivirga sp. MEBiC07777]WVK14996.1 glycoside hydrolase family 36 protein [Flavivirga sp. MEBiC07777]
MAKKENYIPSVKDIQVIGASDTFNTELNVISNNNDLSIFNFNITASTPETPRPITLKWKIPAHNVKGVWKPTTDFAKRIHADWEMQPMESRISIDAPVIGLFGHDDSNRLTFACSNAINKLELNTEIREEDDYFYCYITFFSEQQSKIDHFNAQIRLDFGEKHFSDALKDVSKWWETFENLKPAPVPDIALTPLYSTWYQFHQNLEEDVLLEEFKMAYNLGYKSIIIDDGWQTNDSNRGYDYTGDWNPDRLSKTKAFVDNVHAIGMKVGFWYSVPFCGKKSEAYKQFKGKFLTENHRWAPVFDPRYPEVRRYLINIYKSALINWDLDGFKLDFIDDFRLYPDTIKEKSNGMDYGSINEAVDRLLTDVMVTLRNINPNIFIEFRQKYTGPAMRKYGNMFRAFDCPGDATMNRVRIADIRMLAGNTAVHSDMITWHNEESLEVAALQMVNTLFGVPQISVKLKDIPEDHLKMVKFYTNYWNENKDTITTGNFIPYNPLANYPLKQVSKNGTAIFGVFDDYLLELKESFNNIHIINGKLSESIVIKMASSTKDYNYETINCKGDVVNQNSIVLKQGVTEIKVPACGMIKLTLKK